MRTVAFKEGLKIDSNAIESIIVSANFDMRQVSKDIIQYAYLIWEDNANVGINQSNQIL